MPGARFTEDPRTAEQEFDFPPGTCLRVTDGWVTIVSCDQPHEEEIAGSVDFRDLTAAPSNDVIGDRCGPTIDGYLGAPPVEPWRYGHEGLSPESWEAGNRTARCFVGQWDAAGNLIQVTGSAKG